MAATVEISTILSGIQQTISGLQSVGTAATKVGTDTAKSQQGATTIIVAQQQKQQQAIQRTTSSMVGLRQSVTAFAATLSGTTALLSIFARNNEQLQRSLETVAIASAAAGAAVRVLAAALRFVVTPIGAVVTAVAGAILLFANFEKVMNIVVRSAIKTWTVLGDFFGRLFGSIGNMASGLAQVLFGAFTLDWARITDGINLIRQGLGELGQLGIDTGKQLAAGFEVAIKSAHDLIGSLTMGAKEIDEVGLTPLQLKLDALGEAWKDLGRDIQDANRVAADSLRVQAEAARSTAGEILATHEATEIAKLEMTVERIRAQTEAERQAATESQTFLRSTVDTLSTAVSQAVSSMITAGTSFADAMKSLFTNLASAVISMITKIALEWIVANIIMATSTVAKTATEVSAAAATGGAWAWAAAIKSMGLPGIVIGAGVAAAVIAGIMALMSTIIQGSAAGGMEEIPETGTWRLHRGERVLSRRQNLALDEALETMPMRGHVVNVYYDLRAAVFDEITWEQHIRRVGRDLRRLGLRPGMA